MTTVAMPTSGLIISITPNPALDLTYALESIILGESHRVRAPLVRAGGKGVNVARVAHQLGYSVLALAPVGGPTGAQFRSDLDASGLPHKLIAVAAETRTSIAIVEADQDRTSIFNEYGASLLPSEWQQFRAMILSELHHSDHSAVAGTAPAVLVGSGSLPALAPDDFYAGLVKVAHEHHLPAIIDTSGPGIIESAKAGADLLKPNRNELIEATGQSDVSSGAKTLLQLGAQMVLVSLGPEGMLAFSSDQPHSYLRARLPLPLRGNPTGAGDAAVAGAAAEMASGMTSIERILRSAAAWSAAAVLMPGAGEISPLYGELEAELMITEEKLT